MGRSVHTATTDARCSRIVLRILGLIHAFLPVLAGYCAILLSVRIGGFTQAHWSIFAGLLLLWVLALILLRRWTDDLSLPFEHPRPSWERRLLACAPLLQALVWVSPPQGFHPVEVTLYLAGFNLAVLVWLVIAGVCYWFLRIPFGDEWGVFLLSTVVMLCLSMLTAVSWARLI